MPICFKCGKELATDQSLQYHLQKRVKCNTLNCVNCKKQFPNKLLLENHKHECKEAIEPTSIIRHTIFDQIQTNNIYFIELNKSYDITYLSNNFDNKQHLIKKNINTIFQLEENLKKELPYIRIQHDDKSFHLNIKYNDEYILLIKTLI